LNTYGAVRRSSSRAWRISSTSPLLVQPIAILASLVTVPLFGIVTTTVYGDLTGRPEVQAEPRSPELRAIFAATLVVVGVLSLAIAIPRLPAAIDRLALQAVPAQNRGLILAGPIRNPIDPCQPFTGGTALSSTLPIYIGGYFTKPIPRGETGTVQVYVDERLVNSVPLSDSTRSISCWYEPEALVHATPGRWRIDVQYLDETIAEGIFTIR
jgi:hypothetical protein